MRKRKIIIVAVVTIFIAIVLSFIINILFKIHSNNIFSAEWEPGDALNYVACIFGAVGTIVLGYVAYKQNDSLQELENNNYIANNSAMILVKMVDIKMKESVPVNWDIHSEQIIVDKNIKEGTANIGYEFTFTATFIGNSIPSFICIKECNIFCGNSYLFGSNYTHKYSRVAIHQENVIKFCMTFIFDSEDKLSFKNVIKQNNYDITIEVLFDIITDKNVVTKCKCRFHCHVNSPAGETHWEDTDPMVFFMGHDIIKNYKISGE